MRFSFWATNVGLMLMILGHLFPLGVLQLGDVVTNGYWHARTEWFRNYPWLSMGPDAGRRGVHGRLGPLGLADPQGWLRTRKTGAPADQTGTLLEATLYTEITRAGMPARG